MINNAVKIKTFKIGRRGARGYTLTLPKIWLDDNALEPGDQLDVYRDNENRLIIIKSEKQYEQSKN